VDLVLFATRWADPLGTMTGIGRYMIELTNRLADRCHAGDWKVDVSGPRESGAPAWLPVGVGYRPVPLRRVALRSAWSVANGPALERMIGRFDLLHSLHASTNVPTSRPSVVTVHDMISVEHPEWFGPGVGWAARRAIRRIGGDGTLVITVSEHTARLVEEHGRVDRERIRVIHLAPSDGFRRRVEPEIVRSVCASYGVEPGGYLVAVGNVSTRKNLGTVVGAMAGLRAQNLRLLLCGNPSGDEAAVRAEIERFGVEDLVTLAGFVPDEHLPPLLTGALAVLQPSVDEGFGLPPLEAMAVGTPVVASRAGSHPEIVGSAGLLVDPVDTEAWADAITRVRTDTELRASLATAGQERAAGFTWERTVDRTLDAYQDVLT
jgi:glycosyltransferase involved in cell wall biosynthesis